SAHAHFLSCFGVFFLNHSYHFFLCLFLSFTPQPGSQNTTTTQRCHPLFNPLLSLLLSLHFSKRSYKRHRKPSSMPQHRGHFSPPSRSMVHHFPKCGINNNIHEDRVHWMSLNDQTTL